MIMTMTTTDKAFYLIGKKSNQWLRDALGITFGTIKKKLAGTIEWKEPEADKINRLFEEEIGKD